MSAVEFRDEYVSASTDVGLVHLASQIVQLFWVVDNPQPQISFPPVVRTRILTKAGTLLRRMSEDTQGYTVGTPEYGALPSPSELETSSCLLEAWQESDLDIVGDVRDASVGDERFSDVEERLLGGQLPSRQARAVLTKLFSTLARVVARRNYESPLHDIR